MTWTAPATAVTGNTLTAAFWNAQVRDNFLETGPATAQAAGDIVYVDAANSMGSRLAHPGTGRMLVSGASNALVWRQPVESIHYVNAETSGTFTSTTYTASADGGGASGDTLPSVTVTTGTTAVVVVSCLRFNNSTAGNTSWISFSVSGASTVAAADDKAASAESGNNSDYNNLTSVRLPALTAGSNTFQMEARVSGGSGTLDRPRILVISL